MPLEDPNVIDIIATPAPGKLELVISDAGITADPRERLDRLIAKIKNYVGYILRDGFAADHPGLTTDDVAIVVACANAPTADMLAITHVTPRGDRSQAIAVRYVLFDGEEFTPVEPPSSPPVDRSRILPRLITEDFFDRVDDEEVLPHRPLGDTGLFVAYVVDSEDSVMYVMGGVAEELGLDEPGLHALALENLGRTFGPEVVRKAIAEPAITTIKCLDSFDAARLLLIPGYLRPGEAIAAIIPDRDTLTLLHLPGDNNWTPLAKLAAVPASDHLLLDRPLRVTCDGFQVM
jgi:hypothetical protein